MTTNTFKLTIHMASSLNGIIAKKDNSVSWFETTDDYEQGRTITEEDLADLLKTVDCYVMGSMTYEHALELSKAHGWAYGDIPTIVLTHRKLPLERPNIEFYSGELSALVRERLQPGFKNVWVVGGATLAREMIRSKLADEIRLSILPIILDEGTLLFDKMEHDQLLHVKDVMAYKNGMVELVYEIKK